MIKAQHPKKAWATCQTVEGRFSSLEEIGKMI
jgi:hypothetical protein